MSVSISGTTRIVKAGDKLTVTLSKAWWQTGGIYTSWWTQLPVIAKYAYTISPPPVGATTTAIVDIAINQQGQGKSYGQIADDLDKVLFAGPDVIGIEPLTQSDMRTDVAPLRRTSAEAEATKRVDAANPLTQLFNVGKSLKLVVVLVAVAVILYFVAPLLRRGKA